MALQVKFGKAPAKHDPRTLMFHRYVKPELPPPMETYSALDRVTKNTGKDVQTLFPIDGNDRYGNCVVAGAFHAETTWNGLIGKTLILPEADCIKTYLKVSGGADNGLVMLEFLKYWKNVGFDGHKILAFARISVRDHENVKRATQMFGGNYLGFNVQANAISDFEHHKVWQPGPADGGHCVLKVKHNPQTVGVLTWGDEQEGSWLWWDRQVDEDFAIVPVEAEDPAFAPGFDIKALLDDVVLISR